MRAACCVMTLVLLVFFPAAAVARIGPGTYSSVPPAVRGRDSPNKHSSEEMYTNDNLRRRPTGSPRRELVGSSPPTCVARCGGCVPCKPVHVTVTSPHGGTDYYPEVWRCLCGNKYYMP